jgi:hypothetical protein
MTLYVCNNGLKCKKYAHYVSHSLYDLFNINTIIINDISGIMAKH